MADVIYKRGLAKDLDSVKAQDGQILVTTDTGEMYIDMSNNINDRKKISDNQALMKIITDMAGNNTIDYGQTNGPVYSGLYRVEGYSHSQVHMSIVEYENSSDRVSGIIDPSMIYFTTGTSLETGEYLYIKCLSGAIQQVIRYSDLGLPPYITIGWDGYKASISSGAGALMLSGGGNGSSIYLTENTIHNNAETTIFNIKNKRTLTLQEGGIQLGDDFTQKQLIGVAYPQTETSAANKKYVDDTILEASREIVQTALPSVDFSQTTGPWSTGTYIVKDVIDNTVYFDLTPGYTQTFRVINENKNFKIGDKIVIIVNAQGAAEKIVTVKELTDKMDKSEMIKIDENNSSVEIQASSINFSKLESKNVEILYENCSYTGGSGGLKFRTPYTIYSVNAYQSGSVSIYFDANGSSGCNINIVNNPNVQFFPEDIVSFEADNESNGYLVGGQAISIRVHRVGLSPVDVNLTGIANPVANNNAANKAYVDETTLKILNAKPTVVHKNFITGTENLVIDDIVNDNYTIVQMPANLIYHPDNYSMIKPGGGYEVMSLNEDDYSFAFSGTSTAMDTESQVYAFYRDPDAINQISPQVGKIFNDENSDKHYTIDMRGFKNVKATSEGYSYTPLMHLIVMDKDFQQKSWEYAHDIDYFKIIELEPYESFLIEIEIEQNCDYSGIGYLNILKGAYTQEDLPPYEEGTLNGYCRYYRDTTITATNNSDQTNQVTDGTNFDDLSLSLYKPSTTITCDKPGVAIGIKYNDTNEDDKEYQEKFANIDSDGYITINNTLNGFRFTADDLYIVGESSGTGNVYMDIGSCGIITTGDISLYSSGNVGISAMNSVNISADNEACFKSQNMYFGISDGVDGPYGNNPWSVNGMFSYEGMMFINSFGNDIVIQASTIQAYAPIYYENEIELSDNTLITKKYVDDAIANAALSGGMDPRYGTISENSSGDYILTVGTNERDEDYNYISKSYTIAHAANSGGDANITFDESGLELWGTNKLQIKADSTIEILNYQSPNFDAVKIGASSDPYYIGALGIGKNNGGTRFTIEGTDIRMTTGVSGSISVRSSVDTSNMTDAEIAIDTTTNKTYIQTKELVLYRPHQTMSEGDTEMLVSAGSGLIRITDLADPKNDTDAVNKAYVDAQIAALRNELS